MKSDTIKRIDASMRGHLSGTVVVFKQSIILTTNGRKIHKVSRCEIKDDG